MKRMEWFADKYISKTQKNGVSILDIGSYDVNGCYKEIFTDRSYNYTGLDMENGPNVDIVPKNAYKWAEINTDSYDAVISGQALEHIEFFWLTVAEMIRATKKNGLICIIAPNGFEEHRYPVDCWRFFTDGMVALARYHELEILHAHTNCGPTTKSEEWFSKSEADTILVAKKGYSGIARVTNLNNYKCVPINHNELRDDFKTYDEYLKNKTKSKGEEKIVYKKNREKMKQKLKRFLSAAKNFFKDILEKTI